MPRHANQLLAALGGLCLSFSLIACGPPTLAGAEARYTGNRDKLSAVITRKPQAKAEIEAKLAEFAAEYEKALKETPEEKKIAAIGALANRAKGGAPLSKGDLTQSAGFAGVSGIFRLLPNGTNERGLAVATIRANQVVVVEAAPRSFGGAGF